MVDNAAATIGLNEVALGIGVPKFWVDVFLRRVGHSKGELLLKNAVLLKPIEALDVGLVDVVVSPDKLMSTAEEMILKMISLPSEGRVSTKWSVRSALAITWRENLATEAADSWKFLAED